MSPPQTQREHGENAAKHQHHSIYASETTGLLLIAFMLLALNLIRYWRLIHWSLR